MNSELIITNLHAGSVGGNAILRGVSLRVKTGELHVIMGPNGGGKSTLAQVIMGHPGYEVTAGTITLDKTDITSLATDERAKQGLFLGFQYPVEVPGVAFGNFLRMAINEQKSPKEKALSPIAFRRQLETHAAQLGFDKSLAARSLNQDFSGGEKKKAEILQLAMLKPRFAILDEPDSGLDVDAITQLATAIKQLDFHPGLIVITHYQRILSALNPDHVHVLVDGKIVRSGGPELAHDIEQSGYDEYR